MIPVTQTIVGRPKGNCYAACVASILELDLEDLPNFCEDGRDDWYPRYNRWLRRFGLHALAFSIDAAQGLELLEGRKSDWLPADTFILGGSNPDDVPHAVVWHRGEIWDPNPRRRGIVSANEVTVFSALRPERILKVERFAT